MSSSTSEPSFSSAPVQSVTGSPPPGGRSAAMSRRVEVSDLTSELHASCTVLRLRAWSHVDGSGIWLYGFLEIQNQGVKL